MAKVSLNVTVPEANQFDETVNQAKRLGFEVRHALGVLGILSGDIEENKVAELRKLRGVGAVERDGEVTLAPPGSVVR